MIIVAPMASYKTGYLFFTPKCSSKLVSIVKTGSVAALEL